MWLRARENRHMCLKENRNTLQASSNNMRGVTKIGNAATLCDQASRNPFLGKRFLAAPTFFPRAWCVQRQGAIAAPDTRENA